MGLDECLGDCQAETGSSAGVESHEGLKDRRPLGARDARAGVGHRYDDALGAPALCSDDDQPVFGTVAVRVVDEVRKDLLDQDVVDVDERQFLGEVDLDGAVLERGRRSVVTSLTRSEQRRGYATDLKHAGTNARHVQQVVHQPR